MCFAIILQVSEANDMAADLGSQAKFAMILTPYYHTEKNLRQTRLGVQATYLGVQSPMHAIMGYHAFVSVCVCVCAFVLCTG